MPVNLLGSFYNVDMIQLDLGRGLRFFIAKKHPADTDAGPIDGDGGLTILGAAKPYIMHAFSTGERSLQGGKNWLGRGRQKKVFACVKHGYPYST